MTTKPRYSIDDLLYLMARLRDRESGCPWDCEQDHASLVKYTLEEAYEVADAIERGDIAHLPEELGDLLFQVVFYAQVGAEQNQFDFTDIVDAIVAKLVFRHPHVFPDGTLHSRRDSDVIPEHTDISSTWEKKKHQERQSKGHRRLLADIPVAMPALARAEKIQKRAAKAGFDWPDVQGVLAKIREEVDEFAVEVDLSDGPAMEEELGDIFFSVVNLARHVGCDAEQTLRRATQKFERRFETMEDLARVQGHSFEELDAQAMDRLWREAKRAMSRKL